MYWGTATNTQDEDEGHLHPHLRPEESSSERDPFEQQLGEDENGSADVAQSHLPATEAEKRRARNVIFENYATIRATEAVKNEIEEVKEAIRDAKDETLSVRDILIKQEVSAHITSPRDYQTELYQKAKEKNIIAVLDTGSGKTHIATLLLRHILDLELEARAKGGPNKVAFFLVCTPSTYYESHI